jgi:CheY-like chemotaxis protein
MKANYTFLVIDDNQIDQLITRQLFKKILDVSEINIANNGKEGIKWVCDNRRIFNEPLIILLDIQMPIMNGSQFLLEYEKLEEELKRDTQIFILSSSLESEEINRLKDSVHVTDFLSKPISVKEFGRRIYSDF